MENNIRLKISSNNYQQYSLNIVNYQQLWFQALAEADDQQESGELACCQSPHHKDQKVSQYNFLQSNIFYIQDCVFSLPV